MHIGLSVRFEIQNYNLLLKNVFLFLSTDPNGESKIKKYINKYNVNKQIDRKC